MTESAFTQEILYKHILDNISDGIYVITPQRRIVYWNPAAEKITGHTRQDVVGKTCCETFLRQIDEEGQPSCGVCPGSLALQDLTTHEKNVYFQHRDGFRVPVLLKATPILGPGGTLIGVAHIFQDNTTNEIIYQNLEELKKQVYVDRLTGLFNRQYLEMRISGKIDEFRRYNWKFGLIFIDVDHFKDVNDRYGHAAGDEILRLVSQTFQANTRPSDVFGRWGGEEFVGLISSAEEQDLFKLARRFRMLVANSNLRRESEVIHVTISVGATLVNLEDTVESLVTRADQLMYQSKQNGRNRVTMEFTNPLST
ncbi:MAG: sensor domain-containing diguanylate cyclase [Deltaproteobacteria bacterium HGW-Deltaproteobacteria-22]|nr:MAG: sensor domain-containing diguanylate cyclase [Deltaproteobacteria bacterium HGW-Deltaproteobacteria-22]